MMELVRGVDVRGVFLAVLSELLLLRALLALSSQGDLWVCREASLFIVCFAPLLGGEQSYFFARFQREYNCFLGVLIQ